MSYYVIMGPDDGRNFLCDYRPDIGCPQWYRDIRRAFKFTSRERAEAFRAEARKPWELGMMRIAFITTRADRRVRLAALLAENERLRTVIRTGGAMYRAERAGMGIPGGLDPYCDPWTSDTSSPAQVEERPSK